MWAGLSALAQITRAVEDIRDAMLDRVDDEGIHDTLRYDVEDVEDQ